MIRSSLAAYPALNPLSRGNVRLAAALSRSVDCIVYNSKRSFTEHREFGFDSRRAIVLHNGVDVERFRPSTSIRKEMRRKLGVKDCEIIVGLVGRVHPVKDHETFISAASGLVETFPEIRFALAGRGADQKNLYLAKLMSEAGVSERFLLCGEVSTMETFWPGVDIAVSSSKSEGFSNSIVEAMACEIPTVVTDVGDSAFAVGEWGTVVPVGEPKAIAASVARLIRAGAGERARLGKGARERVCSTFEAKSAAAQAKEILRTTMSLRSKRR